MKQTQSDIGIIVGRFQVADLHPAHIDLIETVVKAHKRVHILLGVSPLITTYKDPLPFEVRRQMIEAKFPDIRCYPIMDIKDDEKWVENVDALIKTIEVSNSITLYGGRDSFIYTYVRYKGKFSTVELEPNEYVSRFSGTNERSIVSKNYINSPDFRAGIIWANYNKFPTVYSTVDAFIMNPEKTKVLLCKKQVYEKQWRFVGGFADTKSYSFRSDVQREILEETGMRCKDIKYLGDFHINDWRYSYGYDKIRTNFFFVTAEGEPTPNDDIIGLKWFDIKDFCDYAGDILFENHANLFFEFENEIKELI